MSKYIQKFIQLHSTNGDIEIVQLDTIRRFAGKNDQPATVHFDRGGSLSVVETVEKISKILSSNLADNNLLDPSGFK